MSVRSRRSAGPIHFFLATIGALLVAAGLGSVPGDAQSFPCRYARYPDEKTICQDPSLGQLDQELAAVYRRAMLKLSRREAERLDKDEELFVTARHRCREDHACIEQSYRNRFEELQSAFPDEGSDKNSKQQALTKAWDPQQPTSDQNPPEPAEEQPKPAVPSGGTNWVNPAPSR